MSTVSFIGTGHMAQALATRAITGGNTVEVIDRNTDKAKNLAAALGHGTTVGAYGAAPRGDIVVLAVLYTGVVQVVDQFADALANKIIIDISNPFNSDASGLVTSKGLSAAQEVAQAAPSSAKVIKAFNTVFGNVLDEGHSMDAFFAGDDAQAKRRVSTFITSLGLRPVDVGGLNMAHWLEGAGLLLMGAARYGTGSFNISFGVTEFE